MTDWAGAAGGSRGHARPGLSWEPASRPSTTSVWKRGRPGWPTPSARPTPSSCRRPWSAPGIESSDDRCSQSVAWRGCTAVSTMPISSWQRASRSICSRSRPVNARAASSASAVGARSGGRPCAGSPVKRPEGQRHSERGEGHRQPARLAVASGTLRPGRRSRQVEQRQHGHEAGVDQRPADDHVDVVQPVAEDGDGHQRREQHDRADERETSRIVDAEHPEHDGDDDQHRLEQDPSGDPLHLLAADTGGAPVAEHDRDDREHKRHKRHQEGDSPARP